MPRGSHLPCGAGLYVCTAADWHPAQEGDMQAGAEGLALLCDSEDFAANEVRG